MISSPGATISVQCFTQQTADETLGQWIDVRGRAHLVFYITGTGVTSSGAITFEEAAPDNLSQPFDPVFGATTDAYSAIGSATNASEVDGGQQLAVHLTVAAYCFVRARISTVIGGGGSISVGLVAY